MVLVHNPKAGDKQHDRDWLVGLARDAGHEVTYVSSHDPDWCTAVRPGLELVVVAGGDGTVGRVAKWLAGKRVPMAILPMGTANNIATTLGVEQYAAADLFDGWRGGRCRPFDLLNVAGTWEASRAIESAGIGLLADVIARADEHPHIDPVVIFTTGLARAAAPVDIVLDGKRLSGSYALAEVMNIPRAGPGLLLAGEADPGDGLLDVVLLERGEPLELTNTTPAVDAHLHLASAATHRGRHVRITWTDLACHVDDELRPRRGEPALRGEATLDITVQSHAIEFLVPA